MAKMDRKIIELTKQSGFEVPALLSFMDVETGGKGFDETTGKMIIQFEPVWFKREAPYAPSGLWSVNGVERQSKEWIAFNDAFKKNPDAAMQATSIGLGQIMGLHYKRLGYKSVGEMWDDAKKGLDRQVYQLVTFINTDDNLKKALIAHDWDKVASIYNGPKYKELAVKLGRTPYDKSFAIAYDKYKNIKS
jgi:hypothetical protein